MLTPIDEGIDLRSTALTFCQLTGIETMRIALAVAAATAVITVAPAFAAPRSSGITIDKYAFAGGREATMIAPMQTGRSGFNGRTALRPFTKTDVSHAFASWAFPG